MPPKRRRIDSRRQPDPPKSYEVEKLVEFRERIVTKGKFTVPKSVLEYKVRWAGEWNDPKHDCWTKKENINVQCIREFDGDYSTVGERLATVPAALHPSHPGYATAMRMAAMQSQVVVIQRRSEPKRRQMAQSCSAAAAAAAIAISPEEKQAGSSIEECSESNSSPSTDLISTEKGQNQTEDGGTTDANDKPAAIPLAKDDTESTAAVKPRRNFNEFTLIAMTRWVHSLDKVVAAGRAVDPMFASLYESFFTKGQKKEHCMEAVAKWEEHKLDDGEALFEIRSDGWSCNLCPNHHSVQKRADKIYKHLLSQSHIKEVQARAYRRGTQSVESVSMAHARLQAVPQTIRQGACIAAAQASLPFTAGSLMLAGVSVATTWYLSNVSPFFLLFTHLILWCSF